MKIPRVIRYTLYAILPSAFLIYILLPAQLPLSPLSTHTSPSTIDHQSSFIILGFAPYWNLKKISPESTGVLTHFAYFALHLDGSGQVYTHVNRREQDPGYTNYRRIINHEITLPEEPLILTFMPASQDSLSSILSSSSHRAQAIQTILAAVDESGASGINVDFEPLGDTPTVLRDQFTLFIQELHDSLKSKIVNPKSLLTISIYPSAAARPRLWDLAALAPLTDYFVVMTYDYTMPLADNAGPNSPLRDVAGDFEHNVVKNIAEIAELVPSRQILLGIPFYGYEWDTVDESKYAPAQGRGATASLERIQQMLDAQTLSLLWDRNSLTAYGVATTGGTTSQIYFDNEMSLRLKLDLVRAADLGGIAVWALGYDNNVPWLWPTIRTLNE